MSGNGRFVKGQPAWNKKEKIKKICPTCEAIFFVIPALDRVVCCSRSCARKIQPSPMKGRTTPPEVRAKQRAAKLGIRGPDHWNWRGGSGTERHQAMNRDEYRQWRTAVFERDKYTCVACHAHGVKLHADHIKPWATHPDRRYDVTNGRTLCVPCHCETPSFPARLIPKELRI